MWDFCKAKYCIDLQHLIMQGNSHEHKITQNDMNSAVDLHYQESIIMFSLFSIFITVFLSQANARMWRLYITILYVEMYSQFYLIINKIDILYLSTHAE